MGYIHPDSPLQGSMYNDVEYDLTDAIYFLEMEVGSSGTNTKLDFDSGAEAVVLALESGDFLEEIVLAEAEVIVDYSYINLNDNMKPAGYEDVKYTVTYKGEEIKEATDTIANKIFLLGSDTQGRDILTRILYGA